MNASTRGTGRQYWVALRALLIFTVVLGVAYPLVVTGIGQLTLPAQANGSTVTAQGNVVGSSLIGQSFTDKKGSPLPQWFQSRPSAAGDGYDGGASSGSNLGPNNPDLLKSIDERAKVIEKVDGVSAGQIPPDALTASGSGLDPHISPAYALLQVDAVAKARGISADRVRALVDKHIQQRDLGYLGEPTVNVLQLNIALEAMAPSE
ncbi:K+-transporting ATPase ATPase C chain [Leifsonia sp. 98AMF]|uniref:K(+)-transporting ATPase subunit C n=1 Tax=unclassified Leifsonia TaxID=2663824 RepID=UPI00087D17CD|nr:MULTISPECIES: K(+)-transporting ATPase subunit C [unclassified Leifsonia]SDH73051.1 K+-transporting ATPase ATPase C chain [Leifsonia sp. 197AMF]SDJ48975.1 K+-transporting ATPase ATPase C chain [Leifsonia sp. 466MF]SDK25797.1 K+-transporting ATPase ATPase C chain [Leifsonia sp. 157MF]SDN68841.1 K+-transporting ATPase ATPase C chain [Leifsonia sp. 509MF]SEN39394.1 K+-transporting ATPase ATPase C chain [Leifsonia sp. 467MF]